MNTPMKDNMKQENKTTQPFRILNFNEAYVAPEYKLNPSNGFIEWGRNNEYPRFLLDLYNNYGSTTHKSIINKKVRLSTGFGIQETLNPILNSFIKKNKLEQIARKLSIDFELFNGYCFEIIWNREGTNFSIRYIPFHKVRIGLTDEKNPQAHYLYSHDWKQFKKDGYKPEYIMAFNPNVRQGRQLYYFVEHNPQQDGLYPIPNYSTSLNYIQLDFEVSKFHLNQVKQGFSPSLLINFATGIPTIEEMDEYYRDFKRNYASADNSGKVIITYSEGVEQKPEITPINLNDSDERFIMLQDMVEKNIVMGHEIPPQLVVLTPGKLGSSDERKELLQEFQQYYITPRQEQLEVGLNEVIEVLGFTEYIILNTYQSDIIEPEKRMLVEPTIVPPTDNNNLITG
jgi:hypothetical protein